MDYSFRIGELAGIFDISIRALRLYDKMGVLKPELVDERTGYRYYSTEQVMELQTILALKNVGFSLMEPKLILDDPDSPDKLLSLLDRKRDHWMDQIEIAKFKIRMIADLKKSAEEQAKRQQEVPQDPEVRAYRLSRLVSMESAKNDTVLTEVLWM